MTNPSFRSQSSSTVMIVFLALAALIYILGVRPALERIIRIRRNLASSQAQLQSVVRDLKSSHRVDADLSEGQGRLLPYRKFLLEPLLGSSAMRMKSLLDPLAAAAGLKNVSFTELPSRTLPPATPPARQPYVRQPIRMSCTGSYAAAISFLLRLKEDFPLAALAAVSIAAQQDADAQKIEYVIECPAKGICPAATANGKVAPKP